MFAKVKSLGIFGMDAFSVVVEADISRGVPRFDIVGLPDTAARGNKKLQFSVPRFTNNG